MEADSTTFDNSSKNSDDEPCLPFSTFPGNLQTYRELVKNNRDKSPEYQIVERLQKFGLIPSSVKCPSGQDNCRTVSKIARVVDKVQWYCDGCGKRQPIRTGSFFFRIQCSILQTLQMLLAWCEDADLHAVAQHFGVKPRVASTIYERLDELAVKEQKQCKLGGENSVVLTEMYPDCLTRLSPDTTDQPHVHRILMIADTKHVPTRYYLHVIKEDLKKNSGTVDTQALTKEIQEVISRVTDADSILVTGSNIPAIEGASTVQQLVQYCDVDMQHFLTTRIWRQAMCLCIAARDLCGGGTAGGGGSAVCAAAVQRYLHTSLHRLRQSDGFYRRLLRTIAHDYTDKYDDLPEN